MGSVALIVTPDNLAGGSSNPAAEHQVPRRHHALRGLALPASTAVRDSPGSSPSGRPSEPGVAPTAIELGESHGDSLQSEL